MTSANKWLTSNIPSPIPVADTVIGVLDPVISVISGLLDITAAVLDILAFLSALSADPLQGALEALFNTITDILDSLINMAFTVFLYVTPGSDATQAGGYNQFLTALEESLDDPGDKARPRLKTQTPFFALAVGSGSLVSLDIMNFLKQFATFMTEKFNKVQNALFTFIPQAPGLGVVTGLEAVSKGNSITVAPGKFLQKDTIDSIYEFSSPTDVYDFESDKVYVLVAFKGSSPSLIDTYIVPAPIGSVTVVNPGTEEEDRIVSRDITLLTETGFSTTFLAYFETDSTGNISYFNPDYRKVLVGYNEEELKDQLKKEQAEAKDPNWHGFSLQSINWFEPLTKSMNEAKRKGQPQSNITDSLTQLKNLVTTISTDLDEVSTAIKDAATGIQSALEVIGTAGVLFITPFPSLLTGKDPYLLNPNDAFTLEMDPLSQAGGAPAGVKTISFSATPGSYTGIDNVNFSIPSGTKFWMDTYLRRSRLLPAGTVDATFGLTGGTEGTKGIFVGGSDSRFFRIPNAGADFKISTFGKGIEITAGANSLHTLLSLPVSSEENSIESSETTFKYHYPSGASFKLSVWSKDTAVYNTANSILPALALSGAIYDPGLNSIRGNDARLFTVPANTGCRINTFTNRRSYLNSVIKSKIGFNTHTTDVSGTIDTGLDARTVYIPGIGGYRATLGIRSIARTPSAVIDNLLGLTSITTEHGSFTGEDALQLSSPSGTFVYSTYVNKASSISGEVFDLVGWSPFSSFKGTVLSTDRRLFNWPVTAGFNLTVRNASGVIFSGQTSVVAAGVNRNGNTLASQVTFAMRQLPGARGIETCTFESNGTFKFYFGNDVTDATFAPHGNPGKDLLTSLGVSPALYVPVSFFISGVEPAIYKITGLGDFKVKLGKNLYVNYIPQGTYTGTNLASLIEAALQLATGRNEQVTYNASNGRFNLLLDPLGYISSENQTISLLSLVKQPLSTVSGLINPQIILEDNTEQFSFADDALRYTQDGLVSIDYISGSLLNILGLPVGLNNATLESFEGSSIKNFIFNPGDNILQLVVNKSPLVIPMPTNVNMSFDDISNFINAGYASITCEVVDGVKFKLTSNFVFNLITNYLFFYASASNNLVSTELVDLKGRFDTALGDSLVSITFSEDKFSIDYPDLEEVSFTAPGIGNTYINKFGFQDASGLVGSYTGTEAAILEIDPTDSLDITLGSSSYSVTIPAPGEYTNSSFASTLGTELSNLLPVSPAVSYDSLTGLYTFDHDNTGYPQIVNELIVIPPASGQSGINIATTVQSNLRSLPTASGLENCIFIADKFLLTAPGLQSIEFISEVGYYSLPLLMGLGFNSYPAEAGRVSGLDPAYFFITPSSDNFDYGLTPFISNVVVAPSTDFESGDNLATRVQTALQLATGGNESFTYNLEDGYFELTPDPGGFQLLNNQDITLPANPGYVTPEVLTSTLNGILNTALVGLGISYLDGVFKITYPGMAKLEISSGISGLKLEDLLGYTLGVKTNLNSEVSSDQELKYLAFHADADTLHIRLGGVTHAINFPVTGVLKTPNDFLLLIEAGIQTASGRNTSVSYDAISKNFKISIDPQGEKIIEDYIPTFPGGSFLSLADVITEINNIASFSGATGGEIFTPSVGDTHLIFEDLTGLTLSVVTSVGSLFDPREALGISSSISISGPTDLNSVKHYIIRTGENNLFNFDLNTDAFNLVLPQGIYGADDIVPLLEGLFSAELDLLDITNGVFTIVSNPDGRLWSTKNIQLAATTGPLIDVTNALEAAVHFVSAEDDEIFVPDNSKISEFKPDLRAVVFREDLTSSVLKILKILGFTPDFRYETDTESILFSETSPFSVTLAESDFKIKYDNTLDLGTVRLPVVEALSGTEMAEHIQKTLRSYLTSFIVRDILYSVPNPLPLVGPPVFDIPTYVNSFVSDFLVKDIEKKVIDSLFSNINNTLYQQLQISFPTDFNIPLVSGPIEQLASLVNSSFPTAILKIGDKLIKDGVKNLIRVTMVEIYNNVPGQVDPDDFQTTLVPIINNAISTAAAALSFPITPDVKTEVSFIMASSIEEVFTDKYFYDTLVTYNLDSAEFTVTSPAKGALSRVEILPADTLDITNHLGLDVGSETVGTGNVDLIHCTTSEEVATLFNAQGFQSFSFGMPSFRKPRNLYGDALIPDYRYPHRYYVPEELPWASEVYLMVRSLNVTPNGSLTIINTVGSPTSAIGIPTGNIGPVLGRSGFTGAFREAGPFNNPKIADKGFVVVGIAAIVLPDADPAFDFLKTTYNSVATLIGLPTWP